MDWYFLEESDDLLVPTDQEPFENLTNQEPFADGSPFSDEWRSWAAVAQSKSSQPYGNVARQQHGPSLYVDEMKESTFREGDRSGNSTAWGGSTPFDCCTRSSEESFEGQIECEMQNNMERMDNNFLDSFLEEDMRNTEDSFEPLQMFPGSMYRSLSFENILTTMLTDPQNYSVNLNGSERMNDLEACGIPLFTNDLSEDFEKTDDCSSSCVMPNGSVILSAKDSEPSAFVPVGGRTTSKSKLVAEAEYSKCLEATVLRELEDVILQLNEKTRVCFRDSLYRLANSSSQQRKRDESTTTETNTVASDTRMEGESSRPDKSERAETETNIIDRTVANLVFNQSFAGSSDSENPVFAS